MAGKNFGCGSSREQAASRSKAGAWWWWPRITRASSSRTPSTWANPRSSAPTLEASEGDDLEITETEVVNKTTGKSYPTEPLPQARQAIVDAGGLIPYARKKLVEARGGK